MITITLQNTTPHHILNQKPQWANTTSQVCGHCPDQHKAILAAGGHQEHPNVATQNLVLSCFYRHSEPQGWLWVFTSVFPVLSFPFPILSSPGVTQGVAGEAGAWAGQDWAPAQADLVQWVMAARAPLAQGSLRRAVPSSLWCCLKDAFLSREQNFDKKSPSIAQHPKSCSCVTGAVHCTQTAGTNWALGVFW